MCTHDIGAPALHRGCPCRSLSGNCEVLPRALLEDSQELKEGPQDCKQWMIPQSLCSAIYVVGIHVEPSGKRGAILAGSLAQKKTLWRSKRALEIPNRQQHANQSIHTHLFEGISPTKSHCAKWNSYKAKCEYHNTYIHLHPQGYIFFLSFFNIAPSRIYS